MGFEQVLDKPNFQAYGCLEENRFSLSSILFGTSVFGHVQ